MPPPKSHATKSIGAKDKGAILPEEPFHSGLIQPVSETNSLLELTNALLLTPPSARSTTPDDYLQRILMREAVDTGPFAPVRSVQSTLRPVISAWANQYLIGIHPSGSFAKGTANRAGTNIDLLISLSDNTPATLKHLYEMLCSWMHRAGYTPKRRNVSINVNVDGYDVDLIPARRQNAPHNQHSLYRRKAEAWTITNVVTHTNHIASSGRLGEIRTLKLWRNQKGLIFPSFYLEMTVMAALQGSNNVQGSSLATNVLAVLVYLRDTFLNAKAMDPANPNNVISDDLTAAEKRKIRAAAEQALTAKGWDEIIV